MAQPLAAALPCSDRDAGAELALGDQLAFRVDANLSRHEQQVAGADEADVVRHRGRWLMQLHALRRKFLLDRTRHVPSPVELTDARSRRDRAALFRASRQHMQARRRIGPKHAEKHGNPAGNWYFFVKRP